MDKKRPIEAIVKSKGEGPHGKYVITNAKGFVDSITFSLEKEEGVWQENEEPAPGFYVVLSDIRKKRVRGRNQWQAFEARFFRPEDEKKKKQTNENKEQTGE